MEGRDGRDEGTQPVKSDKHVVHIMKRHSAHCTDIQPTLHIHTVYIDTWPALHKHTVHAAQSHSTHYTNMQPTLN